MVVFEEWRSDPWRLSPEMLKIKFDIRSKINIPLFKELLLKAGYDVVESAYILDGLINGFSMGLGDGPFPPPKLWAPSFLTDEERTIVSAYLDSEVALKRIFGPFLTVPRGLWARTVGYPMSIAPKSDGGTRIISNLSANGKLLSVNGFIPKCERTTAYPSFLEVAQAMCFVGLDVVHFAVFDIMTAYRNLGVRPQDWYYSIICWQEYSGGPRLYYLDANMVFGAAPNCRIFNRFADALAAILRDVCFVRDASGMLALFQRLLKYLDDFLLMASSAAIVNMILDRMLALMLRFCIPIKTQKTMRASVTVKFLGYWWIPRFNRITLDAKRWCDIEGRLEEFRLLLVSGTANAQDLRCLTGLLVWAAVVIPSAKVFNRGFHTVLQRLKATSLPASEARKIIIVQESLIIDILVDLSWWADLCCSFRLNGSMPTGILISEVVYPRVWSKEDCGIILYSDASNLGIGGYQFGPVEVTKGSTPVSLWCYLPLPVGMVMTGGEGSISGSERRVFMDEREVGSGYTEAAGLLYVLSCFLPAWAIAHPERQPGIGVWCHSDSLCLVHMWSSKRAGVTLLPYLRAFARLAALYNINLIIVHIPGVSNKIADAISRQKLALMRQLLPDANLLPTVPLFGSQIFF